MTRFALAWERIQTWSRSQTVPFIPTNSLFSQSVPDQIALREFKLLQMLLSKLSHWSNSWSIIKIGTFWSLVRPQRFKKFSSLTKDNWVPCLNLYGKNISGNECFRQLSSPSYWNGHQVAKVGCVIDRTISTHLANEQLVLIALGLIWDRLAAYPSCHVSTY